MAQHKNELENFLAAWEQESAKTVRLLEALPPKQYDYRPDMTGRSLGELAWHLAEIEAYMTYGIELRKFELGLKPPNSERPREVMALAPGYQRLHEEAVARVKKLKVSDLDRKIRFISGQDMRIGDVLWSALLRHHIHHRGQLTVFCRLAGGKVPGLYGPTREEMAALRAQLQPKA